MPEPHRTTSFTITAPRVSLRRFTADDAANLEVIHCDPAVMEYIDTPGDPASIVSRVLPAIMKEYAELDAEGGEKMGLGRLAVLDKDGVFLGGASLRPPQIGGSTNVVINPTTGDVEIGESEEPPPTPTDPIVLEQGYRIVPAAWGRGYASEVARALVDYAFTNLHNVGVITATAMAVHGASSRVLHNAGLQCRGIFHFEFDVELPGAEEGDVVYSITKKEWLEQQRQKATEV